MGGREEKLGSEKKDTKEGSRRKMNEM